jgi:hypothetical protein
MVLYLIVGKRRQWKVKAVAQTQEGLLAIAIYEKIKRT